ncbi:MAG: PAS domain S-box protein [Methylococcaceae bacterium]
MDQFLNYQRSDWRILLALATSYVIFALLMLNFATFNGNITIFWISGGLALGVLLIKGIRLWPGVFLGALITDLIIDKPLSVAFFIALGHTLETVVAVNYLHQLKDFNPNLTKLSDFLKLAIVGGLCSFISALIGPLTLLEAQFLTANDIAQHILHWWQADTLGIILASSCCLIWRHWPRPNLNRQQLLIAALFYASAFLTGQMIFLGWFHENVGELAKLYWVFFFVVVAALNYGRSGTLFIVVTTVCQSLYGAASGIGYLDTDIQETGLQNFWYFTMVLSLTGITLAIVVYQREQINASLQKESDWLRESQRVAQIGSWLLDGSTGKTTWSDETYTIYGVSPADFEPCIENLINCIHPDDRIDMQEWLKNCTEAKHPLGIEFRCIHPDSTIHHLYGQGDLVRSPLDNHCHILGTVQDITERKRVEQLLINSEMMLQTIFASSLDGVIVADAQTLKVVFFNDAICRLLGYTQQEFGNMTVTEMHHDEDLSLIKNAISQLKQGSSGLLLGLPFKHKDGSKIYFDNNASILNLGGNLHLMGIFRDITARTKHEAHIDRLNKIYAALAQTNHMTRHAVTEVALFKSACRVAVEEGGMKMAWIGIADITNGNIMPVASYGAGTDFLEGMILPMHPDTPEGRSPTSTALRECRPVVSQDLRAEDSRSSWANQLCPLSYWQAIAAFPILKNQQAYAVFSFYHGEKNAFDDLNIGLLTAMVNDIAFALEYLENEKERTQAINSLRDSEERYRTLSDLIPEQIWTATPEGLLDYVNQRVIDYFGRCADDLIGENWQKVVHPDDLDDLMLKWQTALQTGTQYEFDARFRYCTGEYRWCTTRALPTRDEQRRIVKWYGVIADISERRQSEEKLRLTARVFETTMEGIIITDANGEIIEVNNAFVEISGYSHDEVIGKNPRLLSSGHHNPEFYADMWQSIYSRGHWSGEIWNRHKDGEIYPEILTISAITNNKGVITHYIGISSDITLLKQHEKQLLHIAQYDALTGIPNRVLLTDRIQQALAQTRREKKFLLIAYIDLDGFKSINESFGHDIGDKVLIKIARRIDNNLRGGDTVARIAGDEFVVLQLSIECRKDAKLSLDRLLKAIEQPLQISGHTFIVTGSIGVTLYPLDDEEPDTLLRHADQAMFIAKQQGKNRYHIFDTFQDVSLKLHYERYTRIEQALANSEFELYYQPKVALFDNCVVGAEALIRWRHPELGVLAPGEFLPIIENSDLDIKVGEWVIDQTLAQLLAWQQKGLDFEISINISAKHLQKPHFVENLQQKLTKYAALSANRLQIEILETTALADIARIAKIIEECGEMGIQFALDDFGTGYSSLTYLRQLPATVIKIDQSFVRDMLVDPADHAIVQGIIALAAAFNRITVAEGVETFEHYEVLKKMGCHIAQGYGIAHPMPANELALWRESFINKQTDLLPIFK